MHSPYALSSRQLSATGALMDPDYLRSTLVPAAGREASVDIAVSVACWICAVASAFCAAMAVAAFTA